jgi:hypothetical protein
MILILFCLRMHKYIFFSEMVFHILLISDKMRGIFLLSGDPLLSDRSSDNESDGHRLFDTSIIV